MHRYRRLLTEKRIFSPAYYYTVGTSGNAVKYHIISAVLFADQSVYFYVSNSDEIITPNWSLPTRHFNLSVSSILICVCDGMQPVYHVFKNLPTDM